MHPLGKPIWEPAARKKRVWVTIEYPDGTNAFVLYRGYCVASIRKAAKLAWPDCKLGFGNWW